MCHSDVYGCCSVPGFAVKCGPFLGVAYGPVCRVHLYGFEVVPA